MVYMEDRVRIYELARQMNISNQDIITGLRELGYDVKSHSSTIDRNVVGNLIAHLGKKNSEAAAAKEKKAAPKPTGKLLPPPPEKKPVVKPRVLSRYRKEDRIPDEAAQDGVPGAAAAHHPGHMPGTAGIERSPLYPPSGPSPLPASQISSTPRHPRPHMAPTDGRPQPGEIKEEKTVAPSPSPIAVKTGEASRLEAPRTEQMRVEHARVSPAAPQATPAVEEQVLVEERQE